MLRWRRSGRSSTRISRTPASGRAAIPGADVFVVAILARVESAISASPALDRRDAQTGVLAGAWSRLAAFRQGALIAADVDTLGGRTVRGVFAELGVTEAQLPEAAENFANFCDWAGIDPGQCETPERFRDLVMEVDAIVASQ